MKCKQLFVYFSILFLCLFLSKNPVFAGNKECEKALSTSKLSNEELLAIVKDNSPENIALSKRAKQELINQNFALVQKIAWFYFKKAKIRPLEIEDLYQEGCIGLVTAINNFDPSFNCLFSTYAVPNIKSSIYRYIQTLNQKRVFLKKTNQAGDFFDSIENAADLNAINAESDMISKSTYSYFYNRLELWKSTLYARELMIYEKRLIAENPEPLKSIGDHFGLTKMAISKIQQKMMKTLTKIFSGMNPDDLI